jgi:MFS family permease
MASGGLADRFRARLLALAILAIYAGVCVAMARVEGPVMLALVIFGLRFCGQGMMSQIAMTAMGRWFRAERGRAVAIAAMGFSLGEALLPLAGVGLMSLVGWRGAWLAVAGFLLLMMPLVLRLLWDERTPRSWGESAEAAGLDGRHWTRAEALSHPLFWPIAIGVLGPPLIGTSLFFQQARIAEAQGVPLGVIAGAYPLYALSTITASFAMGALIDRYSARSLLPFYQLPMATACLVLALTQAPWTVWLVFVLFGLGQGGASALLGALWPELYGTRHIGAIRGTAVSAMVLSTGLGPGLTGGLLDLGVPILWQFLGFGLLQFGICAGFAALAWRIRRQSYRGAQEGIATDPA